MLGIAAYSLAITANLIVGAGMVALAGWPASGFVLPAAAVRPGVVLALIAYTALGLLLWNPFFAAMASTMSDPANSSRSSLLFLPLVPVVMSIAILRDPDALVARALALFPLTAAPALPVPPRVVRPGRARDRDVGRRARGRDLGDARLAGRIFEVGMLLYGKEPTLREVIRWL